MHPSVSITSLASQHPKNIQKPYIFTAPRTASVFCSPPPGSGFALPKLCRYATTPLHPPILTSFAHRQLSSLAYWLAFVITRVLYKWSPLLDSSHPSALRKCGDQNIGRTGKCMRDLPSVCSLAGCNLLRHSRYCGYLQVKRPWLFLLRLQEGT